MIIGLFSPLNEDLTSTYNALRTIGEVRLIVAGQTRNLGPIDLFVYPDGMGIIPTIGALSHGGRIFIPSKPISPHFFLFWEETPLERFIDIDERNIPVVGIGDAAAMLYDTIGGNVIITPDGNAQLLSMKRKDVKEYSSRWSDYTIGGFHAGNIFGFLQLSDLVAHIDDITGQIAKNRIAEMNNGDDPNEGEDVPKLKPLVPPKLSSSEPYET